MPRYRLLVEYDGRPYHGFQAQGALASVQGSLERAVKGFCGEDIRIHAAGRTDTGVHATGQVIHVDLEKAWTPAVVRDALNAHLVPEPISILEAELAPEPQATSSRSSSRAPGRPSPSSSRESRALIRTGPLSLGASNQAPGNGDRPRILRSSSMAGFSQFSRASLGRIFLA